MGVLGLFLGGPIVGFLEDAISSSSTDVSTTNSYHPPAISNNEVDNIRKLILEGSQNGVSEIKIAISKDMAEKYNINASLPIDNLPVSIGTDLEQNNDGKFFLHVKYINIDNFDKLRKLGDLYKEGVLTKEEFSNAKDRLLQKI